MSQTHHQQTPLTQILSLNLTHPTCIASSPPTNQPCPTPLPEENLTTARKLLDTAYTLRAQGTPMQTILRNAATYLLCQQSHQGQVERVSGVWLERVEMFRVLGESDVGRRLRALRALRAETGGLTGEEILGVGGRGTGVRGQGQVDFLEGRFMGLEIRKEGRGRGLGGECPICFEVFFPEGGKGEDGGGDGAGVEGKDEVEAEVEVEDEAEDDGEDEVAEAESDTAENPDGEYEDYESSDEEDQFDNLVFCRARCGTYYHRDCMDQWLATFKRGYAPTCPTCRCYWIH